MRLPKVVDLAKGLVGRWRTYDDRAMVGDVRFVEVEHTTVRGEVLVVQRKLWADGMRLVVGVIEDMDTAEAMSVGGLIAAESSPVREKLAPTVRLDTEILDVHLTDVLAVPYKVIVVCHD